MRQLPDDPVLVANVPVIEGSRLYTSEPDGARIVSVDERVLHLRDTRSVPVMTLSKNVTCMR